MQGGMWLAYSHGVTNNGRTVGCWGPLWRRSDCPTQGEGTHADVHPPLTACSGGEAVRVGRRYRLLHGGHVHVPGKMSHPGCPQLWLCRMLHLRDVVNHCAHQVPHNTTLGCNSFFGSYKTADTPANGKVEF